MLLGGGSSCQQCGCSPGGCTIKTIGGYDQYLITPKLALAARIGQFPSSITVTSVTITTDGLKYALASPPEADTTPVLQLWVHDATNNLPDLPSVGGVPVPNVLATFTAPGSFAAGDWVFTHAGHTLSANTYYWIVLRNNGKWAYWEENCNTHATFPSSAACIAACCDYWTAGDLGSQQVIWEGASLCGGYVLSINS
jgi:hypothetical protein